MIDYAQIAADALAAIQEAGQEATVKRIDRHHEPVTGDTDSAAAIVGTVSLVVLPVKSSIAEKLERRLQEALTEGRLKMLLVAALGSPVDITVNDVFFLADDDYWIARGIAPLNPGGTVLIYNVIAERSGLSEVDQDAIDIDLLEAAVDALHEFVHVDNPANVNGP